LEAELVPVTSQGSTSAAAATVEVFALALVHEFGAAVYFEEVGLVASFSAAVVVVASGHLI